MRLNILQGKSVAKAETLGGGMHGMFWGPWRESPNRETVVAGTWWAGERVIGVITHLSHFCLLLHSHHLCSSCDYPFPSGLVQELSQFAQSTQYRLPWWIFLNLGIYDGWFFFLKFLAVVGLCRCLVFFQIFSSCGEQRLLSSCSARALYSCGFSCCGAQALLEHAGFSSYSTWAQLLWLLGSGAQAR